MVLIQTDTELERSIAQEKTMKRKFPRDKDARNPTSLFYPRVVFSHIRPNDMNLKPYFFDIENTTIPKQCQNPGCTCL